MEKKEFMKVLHEESLSDWSLDLLKGGAGSKDCNDDYCNDDTCIDNACNGKTCKGNSCPSEKCNDYHSV